jgi:large subunit ribosomal protein L30
MASKYFRIKQTHSTAGRLPKHITTVKALGLKHIGDVRDVPDTPQVRGMITSVHYLLEVNVVAGQLEKKANPVRAKRRALKAKAKA